MTSLPPYTSDSEQPDGALDPFRWPHLYAGNDSSGLITTPIGVPYAADNHIVMESYMESHPTAPEMGAFILEYRTEMATSAMDVNPDMNTAGYGMTEGAVLEFAINPDVTDWMGIYTDSILGTNGQPIYPYGGLIRPYLTIEFRSSNDFYSYDEATDTETIVDGTMATRWMISISRDLTVSSVAENEAAGMLMTFQWQSYALGSSPEAATWNDTHWHGITNFGITDYDPRLHSYIRMRMVTDQSMIFEKSSDGVTWSRLYSSAVPDMSAPYAEGWPGAQANRDGILDVAGVPPGRLSFVFGTGNGMPESQNPLTSGTTYTAWIDHIRIRPGNDYRVVVNGAWADAFHGAAFATAWGDASYHVL